MCLIRNGLLLALGIGLCCVEAKIECNPESEQNLDQIALEMSLFGDPNARHPINAEELSTMCRKDRERLKWIRQYMDDCLMGTITYDVMALASKDLEKFLKKYCDSQKLNKLLLSWSECGNKAKNETMACFKNYVIDLERMTSSKAKVANKDKIPLICWFVKSELPFLLIIFLFSNYFRFDRCAEESFEKPGSDKCSAQAVEGLHSMLTEVLSASIDFLCGEFKADNDKCDSMYQRYKHLNDIAIDNPRKTPVLPFIEIIQDLPQLMEGRNSTSSSEESVV